MRQTILQALEQAYTNLVHMLAEFLPRFLVMLIIIAIGLLVAFVLKYILRALLGLTKLDRVSEEAGASRVLRMAHLPSITELLSRSIFWVTWIGLILVVVIANFLSRTALLAAVNAGHPSAKMLSWSIRFAIWILAISMTLEELGLARQTVISAFSIIFGASMLGLAIAFGLGGQDLARKFLERYLGDTKKEKDKEPQPL
jgi:small-conductance mechanosensitive channel